MLKDTILKQKQAGITLIVFGGLLAVAIGFFAYFDAIRVTGFPEILPADDTVFYLEIPTALDPDLTKQMDSYLKLDWTKAVLPWAGKRAALAFVSPVDYVDNLTPYAIIEIAGKPSQALEFLKNYNNPGNEVRETEINGNRVFATKSTYFTFLGNSLVLTPSEKALNLLFSYQVATARHLSTAKDFIKIRKSVSGEFFLYAQPGKIKETVYSLLARLAPETPFLTLNSPALGIGADKIGRTLQGSSFVTYKKDIGFSPPQAYRAALLPLLPADSELLISGQNLKTQYDEINSLVNGPAPATPALKDFASYFSKEYFPGLDFEKDILSLFDAEFAFSKKADAILFIAESGDPEFNEKIKKVLGAFIENAGRFTPAITEIKLPDGSFAQELVPDKSKIKAFKENFEDITIEGLEFGNRGYGIYYASTKNKWFFSTSKEALTKALVLTKRPGENFRDSALYSTTLRPILKNPALAGVAVLPGQTFGFSKRMFVDHMETNFIVDIE